MAAASRVVTAATLLTSRRFIVDGLGARALGGERSETDGVIIPGNRGWSHRQR